MHLADAFIQSDLQCIQAIHLFFSMCVPWELNPQPFALLTQCSTTEPQERQPCRPIWYSVRRMVWALTGWPPPLQPLQQCWQHSYIYFPNTTSGYDAEHVHSTSFVDHCEACSEWNLSCQTAIWSWPQCCSSVSGSWQSSYSLRHLYVEQQFFFQILGEFFAMRCHVELPVTSMREWER